MNVWTDFFQHGLILFPFPLAVLTLILVIIPTLLAIFLRLRFYYHLLYTTKQVQRLIQAGESRGTQPKLVEKLEERLKQASVKLEQVNTSALIDSLYSQEKLKIGGIKLSFDSIDYFCRMLPNLLLSFGLLGTFLGITFNLYSLSQTINQVNVNDVNNLVEKLQQPLQGMGIAFITSLIGVFCSSFLTVINFKWNTLFVKHQLISALEDYLDNIYFPDLPTHTRMDKAVDRLVVQFSNFLYRFGDTVRDAVERSLGEQIHQIVAVNQKSAELAEIVYSELMKASSSLDSGARTFKEAANTIENSNFADKLATTTTNLDRTYNNFAQSTGFLKETTQLINTVLEEFTVSVKTMVMLGDKISSLNEQCNQLLEANQKQIETEKQALQNIQIEITNLVSDLDQYQQQIYHNLQTLGENLSATITQNMGQNNQQIQEISEIMRSYTRSLQQIQSELLNVITTLQQNEQQIKTELQHLGHRLVYIVEEKLDDNNSQLQFVAETIDKYCLNLKEIQQQMVNLVEKFQPLNLDGDNHNNSRNNNRSNFPPNIDSGIRSMKNIFDDPQ